MPVLTCGTCVHWHRKPSDPSALGDVRGTCQESPPGVSIEVGQQAGRDPKSGLAVMVQVQVVRSAYPDLPATFAACGRYQEREAWQQDDRG